MSRIKRPYERIFGSIYIKKFAFQLCLNALMRVRSNKPRILPTCFLRYFRVNSGLHSHRNMFIFVRKKRMYTPQRIKRTCSMKQSATIFLMLSLSNAYHMPQKCGTLFPTEFRDGQPTMPIRFRLTSTCNYWLPQF